MGGVCVCFKGTNDGGAYDTVDTQISNREGNEPKMTHAMSESQKLADFNQHGDDRKQITAKELSKLNRYQQFEKKFPFYLMDVNGFMFKVRKAMVDHKPEWKDTPWLIRCIPLEVMAKEFSTHDSWKDLNNRGSDFAKFLTTVCVHEEDGQSDGHISIFKLRNIGLLWCQGDPLEKACELYENMQDPDKPKIAANDKDFIPNLSAILDFATTMVYEQEAMATGNPSAVNIDDWNEKKGDIYDKKAEEFLDSVFESDSRLDRKDWEKRVAEKMAYLFDPEKIRKEIQ